MSSLDSPCHIRTDPDKNPCALASGSLSVNAGQKAHAGLSASEALSLPSVRHIYAVGPRSPFGLYTACLARPGPAHFGSSANPPMLFCHFRIAYRTVSADQPLVALHTSHCRDRDPGAPSAACRLKIDFVFAKGFKSPVADEDDGECPSAGAGTGCRRTDPSARGGRKVPITSIHTSIHTIIHFLWIHQYKITINPF